MANSSTSYRKKWQAGDTTVIRVPREFAPRLVKLARLWDRSFPLHITGESQALIEAEHKVALLRHQLAVSAPGEILFFEEIGVTADRAVRVVANGLGGATLVDSEGPYGVDHLTHEEIEYPSELAACRAAEKYLRKKMIPS